MGLYDAATLAALERGAEQAARAFGLSPRARVALLAISENATFRADDPEAEAPVILRVHRPGYHTRAEILSELAWIDALRAEGVVDTPAPLTTTTGERLAAFAHDGEARPVAAFAFMPGAEPDAGGDLTAQFEALGAITARLHIHARGWARPPGFQRKTWTLRTTIGAAPHWGPWRAAMGLTQEGAGLLERLAAGLERRLGAYGTGPERFGLIHADLRLANLLVDGARLGVIDFDDCGFGWFIYDFAAAVSFIEDDPRLPELQAAWAAGYRRVAPLAAEDEATIASVVMLRRLLLTAWLASHHETPTAQALGAAYTEGTLRLAEGWLSGGA